MYFEALALALPLAVTMRWNWLDVGMPERSLSHSGVPWVHAWIFTWTPPTIPALIGAWPSFAIRI